MGYYLRLVEGVGIHEASEAWERGPAHGSPHCGCKVLCSCEQRVCVLTIIRPTLFILSLERHTRARTRGSPRQDGGLSSRCKMAAATSAVISPSSGSRALCPRRLNISSRTRHHNANWLLWSPPTANTSAYAAASSCGSGLQCKRRIRCVHSVVARGACVHGMSWTTSSRCAKGEPMSVATCKACAMTVTE